MGRGRPDGRGLVDGAWPSGWGGTSPTGWAVLLQETLSLVAVDGAFHSRCAVGDAAEPVQLHQGKVEVLIARGGSSVTDGWGGRQGGDDGNRGSILSAR